MDTTFTHFIAGHTEMKTIRIIEKVGNHLKELSEFVCVEELILNKINEEPEFTSLTFEVKVNNDIYIFQIHRFYLSTWFDGYIEKKEAVDETAKYILDHWKSGLLNNEFSLSYQPILNGKTNDCTNIEALIRWKHKDEYISPAYFIPILEENQQLTDLEDWVIEEVIKQMSDWQQENIHVKTHINISVQTLQDQSFFSRFNEIVSKYKVSPKNIILEITEHSSLFVNESLTNNMEQLANLGVTFAIDDFGVGSTSFSYIDALPISMVKIDKQFLTNGGDHVVLQAIISALNTLNMTIVVEGIETSAMMQQIKKKDIHLIQGYYYSKPLAPAELLSFIRKAKVYFKKNKALSKKMFFENSRTIL